ncbi:MAG: OadG family protein [Bacteroidales bacterium]|nr:OadG family protein [Bacteroidales bacterium]
MNRLKRTFLILLWTVCSIGAQSQPFESPQNLIHNFSSVKSVYVPQMGAYVVIDSADCAVDLLVLQDDSIVRQGRFVTDNQVKRHDVNDIIRPVSVGVFDGRIFFLASAQIDKSYLGVLEFDADTAGTLHLVARRDMPCRAYAMHEEDGLLHIVGFSRGGYDIVALPISDNYDSLQSAKAATIHYRVPKQSERIKETDPIGIGLTAVAVAVVFLALVVITLILQGSSKLISGVEGRKSAKKTSDTSERKGASVENVNNQDDVIAAIAAAVHLYTDELHDDEADILTIERAERTWTPWNAKFYNMNHYFTNRRK